MLTTNSFYKKGSGWLHVSVLVLSLLIITGYLHAHVITFDEQQYTDIANQEFYRGGPNTIIDDVMGLEYRVDYGKMLILASLVQVQPPIMYKFYFYFTPFISGKKDPLCRIVITFNDLQQYVRILVSTDRCCNPSDELYVTYYKNTNPNNPLYSGSLKGAGCGNIEHTDTKNGIKMIIIETKFAENNIEEIEFIPLGESTASPNPPILLSPSNGANGTSLNPTLTWKAADGPTPSSYRLNVRTASGITFFEEDVSGTSRTIGPLSSNTTYLWSMRAKNDAGRSSYTDPFSFTTISDGAEAPERAEEPEGDIVSNWSFNNNMTDWGFYAGSYGASGSGSVENGVFHAQINNGGIYGWCVNLKQNIPIEHGKTYQVSFDAYGDAARQIWPIVALDAEPWTSYSGSQTFSISTTKQTFSFTFTMDHSTDNNARLQFDLGNSDSDVYLDNISVVEVPEETEEPAGNMVSNWSFSNGMDDWTLNSSESGNAAGKVEDGVFHAQITNGGGNVWNVALYKNNLNVIKGKTYKASFNARAASPRNILASVAMGVSPFYLYNFEPDFSITTEWKTYTFTFTMGFDTDPAARMGFDLGASNADVYLDNISLVDVSSSTDVELTDCSQMIRTFELGQNYPNPFNPSTTIHYRVPISCHVNLTICDLLGKEITTLVNETRTPGEYTVDWNAQEQAAGIYFYQLRAGNFSETRKLILQK
ncbi:carbohydrate binding domain-containing protein [bacterium]|nr:carbohydrate binding domain-containing protein [bacterium]